VIDRKPFWEGQLRALWLSLLIALLLSGHRASAQNTAGTGAQITWFGIYTVATKDQVQSGSGSDILTNDTGIIPPATNSDQIVLGRRIRFGFGYILTGTSANGSVEVTPIVKYPPPGILKRNIMVADILVLGECDIRGKDCHVGFFVDDPKGLPTGVWTFQLYDRTPKLLAEKPFTVLLP
jgi:hypothetical protein